MPMSKTGWWNPTPYSSRRRIVFHYVGGDSRTLCGKWLYLGLGAVEEGNDDHPDCCAACRKKKAKLDAKKAVTGPTPTSPRGA